MSLFIFQPNTHLRDDPKSFIINPDATIGRCAHDQLPIAASNENNTSTHGDNIGSCIDRPIFMTTPSLCSPLNGCWCESHHFACTALGDENARWDRFIETGIWENPTQEEFDNFLIDNNWNYETLLTLRQRVSGLAPWLLYKGR